MNSLNPRVVKTNIRQFKPLENPKLPFGRQIELHKALKEWRQDGRTKRAWVSQKRRSLTSALREFKDLYQATEFFAEFGKNDDTFEVHYR